MENENKPLVGADVALVITALAQVIVAVIYPELREVMVVLSIPFLVFAFCNIFIFQTI